MRFRFIEDLYKRSEFSEWENNALKVDVFAELLPTQPEYKLHLQNSGFTIIEVIAEIK